MTKDAEKQEAKNLKKKKNHRKVRSTCLVIAANFSANSASPFIKGNRQPLPSNASTILITYKITDTIIGQIDYTRTKCMN